MSRDCTICHHASRAEIDRALRSGVSSGKVAVRLAVSNDAVKRHRSNHLQSATETVTGESERLYDLVAAIADPTAHADDPRVALHAIREARHLLDLIRRLSVPGGASRRAAAEKSGPRPLSEQPFFQHPEWNEVQRILSEALRPHPEVRQDFFRRLQQMDPVNYTVPPDTSVG